MHLSYAKSGQACSNIVYADKLKHKEHQMADGPFIQYPTWLRKYLRGDPTTTDILLELLGYMNGKTQTLWTSYNHISENTGYHRTTVIKSVNKLVDLGVLIKKVKSKNGRSLPNEYYVNFNNPNYLTVTGVVGELPSPLGVVGELPRGSVGTTPEGSRGTTQIRINKNKETRRENLGKIDPRLMS
jgi:biotin operon repressor